MEYKFSHIGIPTTEDKDWDGYFEPGKVNYTEFDKDEYKVEWVKFDADSPWHELVTTMPHLAYLVDNIEEAIECKDVIVEPFSPAEGVRVVFIAHNGSPIEFMEIKE
ncbi:hypothetical protein [Wenyingzhuangia sp. IMCC45574]